MNRASHTGTGTGRWSRVGGALEERLRLAFCRRQWFVGEEWRRAAALREFSGVIPNPDEKLRGWRCWWGSRGGRSHRPRPDSHNRAIMANRYRRVTRLPLKRLFQSRRRRLKCSVQVTVDGANAICISKRRQNRHRAIFCCFQPRRWGWGWRGQRSPF